MDKNNECEYRRGIKYLWYQWRSSICTLNEGLKTKDHLYIKHIIIVQQAHHTHTHTLSPQKLPVHQSASKNPRLRPPKPVCLRGFGGSSGMLNSIASNHPQGDFSPFLLASFTALCCCIFHFSLATFSFSCSFSSNFDLDNGTSCAGGPRSEPGPIP